MLALVLSLWLLPLASQAGTRLYRSLEDVLRGPRSFLVFEATVKETEFSWRESSDDLNCVVEKVALLRNDTEDTASIANLRFSAYRPAPSSNHKNRSVYSDGSGLEFSLKKGERYLFICANSRVLVRIESLQNRERVLELLRE